MKIQLFESLRLKFEQPDWSRNPEFGLLDTILDCHPEFIKLIGEELQEKSRASVFDRKDMPLGICRSDHLLSLFLFLAF